MILDELFLKYDGGGGEEEGPNWHPLEKLPSKSPALLGLNGCFWISSLIILLEILLVSSRIFFFTRLYEFVGSNTFFKIFRFVNNHSKLSKQLHWIHYLVSYYQKTSNLGVETFGFFADFGCFLESLWTWKLEKLVFPKVCAREISWFPSLAKVCAIFSLF